MYKHDVKLANFTTTKVGGPAGYFVECNTDKDIMTAVKWAKAKEIPYLILGGGSNLLISDVGFPGLVILNRISGLVVKNHEISVKSGTFLLDLVKTAAKHNLTGLASLAGIPGTVGGAIYGNAGAYGKAISDNLVKVKVFVNHKILWVDKKDCGFSYRDSIFKNTKPVILEAVFNLTSNKLVAEETEKILTTRGKKYSQNMWCPGSFFKNVEVDQISTETLKLIPPEKITFGKIPAGYLLEAVGAKGMKKGRIEVSSTHANFFINTGEGMAQDYYDLAFELRHRVKEKFGILLEPEVQIVGFDNTWRGQEVAIFGLGIEGRDLLKYLTKEKAYITIFDKNIQGVKYLAKGLNNFDTVFRSPGVYRYLPEIVEAEKHGVSISSAIKLFFDRCPAKIIGVTGTKGKGTTSTLIYEILKKVRKKVYLVGNIGKPYLDLLPKLNKEDWVVMEMSSFQLTDLHKSPNIAVVLNITQDHLDWHKNLSEYYTAKKNIVRYQMPSDFAILNDEYATSRKFSHDTPAQVKYFSKNKLENKYKKHVLLRGQHNIENIAAAVEVAKILKINDQIMVKAIATFTGLEHRLELVREVDNISFYNDSFATGPQPTIAALNSFSEPETLILGGSDKGLNYEDLRREIEKRENIKNLILIGDIGEKIGRGIKGKTIINLRKTSMTQIVKHAFAVTPKGGVVLFSPAAASFDMFNNYKDRGDQFKKAVNSL